MNINYKDENGCTALHYACDEGNLKIVEILIDADCDTNIKNINKQTPLYLSAKKGYFDISKKLIEYGAELNLEDSEKNSSLHYICKNDFIDLLKYFLTKNVKVDGKNIYGKTPKDLTTKIEIKNLIDMHISNNRIDKTSYFSTATNTPKNNIKNIRINLLNHFINLNGEVKTKFETNKKFSVKDKLLSNIKPYNIHSKITNNKIKQSREQIFKTYKTIKLMEKKYSRNNLSYRENEKYKKKIYSLINSKNSFININNYSIKNPSSHKTDYLFQMTRKKSYRTRKYMSLCESPYNISDNLKLRKAILFNNKFNQNTINHSKNKNKSSPKNKKKPIVTLRNCKINFDTIDSSDKYNFSINKTERYKFFSHHVSNKSLNKYAYLNFNKTTMQKFYQKKKLSKTITSNIINNSSQNNINTTTTSTSKNIKEVFELDSKKDNNIISPNTKKSLKSASTDHFKLSDFICLAKLGKGCFSEVYLIQKINSTKKYAMKVYKKKQLKVKIYYNFQ